MIRRALWEADIARRGVRPLWRELDRFTSNRPDEARRRLARLLHGQIQHFGARADALPEWREAARVRDPDELWRIWPSLPIVGKADLQTRFHPREMVERFGLRGRASSTGGSTGEPTPFFHDRAMIRSMAATRLYAWRRMGWRAGSPVVYVWGSERDIGGQTSLRGRVTARLQNLWVVDGYALDHRTVDRVLHLLREHGQVCMYGFTSMLEFVAREVVRRGDALPGRVKAAWNGGEMLFESQSRVFEEAFGVPILNMYGGRELSTMAFQPAAGLPLQVMRPWLFAEVVDEEGRPVGPGETGRLLWTSTLGRGTPFLRYDVGDLAAYDGAGHDESGIRTLAELRGRQAGLIALPDGRTINGLYWNHLMKEFPEVEQFQVAWKAEEGPRVELRLRGTPLAPEREAHLRRAASVVLGAMPIDVRWVERIPRTAQGKLMQVVRE